MVREVDVGKGTAVACPELVCVCQIFATHKSCYFTKASETQQVCIYEYIHINTYICRNKCVCELFSLLFQFFISLYNFGEPLESFV